MKTFDDRKRSVESYMQKIRTKRRNAVVGVTSLLLVVCVLAAILFVPYDTTPPDVRMYARSEYYGLIQRLNELTYEKPEYKNNFEAIIGAFDGLYKKSESMGDLMNGIAMAPGAPNFVPGDRGDLSSSGAPGANASPDFEVNESPNYGGEEYVEVTDNQVSGVTEADIFKRSDKYVYYLRGGKLSVYTIAQADSQRISEYAIEYADDEDMWYLNCAEMYLSTDCHTITVFMQGYHKTMESFTLIVNLDVSDPANITEISRIYFIGSYLSSRMVDGDFLLTYNYGFRADAVDFNDPTTFVPQYGTPENMTCIPGDSIICPEIASSTKYTVICKLDGESLAVEDTAALLSYSQELYVSQNAIYATHSYTQKQPTEKANQYRNANMTEITGISYTGDNLEVLGTISVEGSIKDQYSLDEFDGILRAVTSTTTNYTYETVFDAYTSVMNGGTKRNVNLYCIDLANWQIAASVIAFAPEGEDAQSVRFDGVNAYVCTAEVITLTDPVYFFDLSDLDHITWTDTGTIDGYSTSLIDLGEGYLLGIGYGDSWNLKVEVYEEYKDQVISVSAYERDAYFSEEYKSYLVDRENNLIGLAVQKFNGQQEYVLLHFDGYALRELELFMPVSGSVSLVRAFHADGWLYVLCAGTDEIFVTQIW